MNTFAPSFEQPCCVHSMTSGCLLLLAASNVQSCLPKGAFSSFQSTVLTSP